MIMTHKLDELIYPDTPQILEHTLRTVSADASFGHSRSKY